MTLFVENRKTFGKIKAKKLITVVSVTVDTVLIILVRRHDGVVDRASDLQFTGLRFDSWLGTIA